MLPMYVWSQLYFLRGFFAFEMQQEHRIKFCKEKEEIQQDYGGIAESVVEVEKTYGVRTCSYFSEYEKTGISENADTT